MIQRIRDWFAPETDRGRYGEKQAEIMLKRKGYRILGRRVRVGRRDELDLIARSNSGMVVFVEVKTRKNEDFGRPAASVDRGKRYRISRAASRYLRRLKRRPDHIRFDIVEVIGEPGSPPCEIRHIEQAFALEGGFRF